MTEKTFKKHLKELEKYAAELKSERELKEKEAIELSDYRLKETTEKIKSLLTEEKIKEWSAIGANEGNSHTRRTRWSNRVEWD